LNNEGLGFTEPPFGSTTLTLSGRISDDRVMLAFALAPLFPSPLQDARRNAASTTTIPDTANLDERILAS
jgi:hypothetical protein